MPAVARRWLSACFVAVLTVLALINFADWRPLRINSTTNVGGKDVELNPPSLTAVNPNEQRFHWANVPQRYPVSSMLPIPTGRPLKIPNIQHASFLKKEEKTEVRKIREARLQTVKGNFEHAWKGYKKHAWMKDEVSPVSGGSKDPFGGWAATLVDSLDTLWIMGMREEFNAAVAEVTNIDFTKYAGEVINVFETNIRFLGGFLGAYDLSENQILLEKAIEVGEMLYVAFDTPERMPMTRWNWTALASEQAQVGPDTVFLAEIGSLSLEFTRLSQLSKNPKFFDAIQRIMDVLDSQQNRTKLPGMWPMTVSAQYGGSPSDGGFSVGALADSFYEYLPKQYMLLGGLSNQYRKMYEGSIEVMKQHNFFRPLNRENLNILISGNVQVGTDGVKLEPQAQHLACFTGGMVGIGARIFERDDLETAQRLIDGCIWSYQSMPTGIMPESSYLIPCDADCRWDESKWHQGVKNRQNKAEGSAQDLIFDQNLQPGFTEVAERSYKLRPEAIESIFILYRITGDTSLQDTAWKMFQAIERYTKTHIAHAAIDDVTTTVAPKADSMESFWMAETLKYFYLIFSTPDIISLDDYVLNTEAHPFKRPKQKGWWIWKA